jgi:hypothetical protein
MIDQTDPIERAVKEFQSGVNVEGNGTKIFGSFKPRSPTSAAIGKTK